MLSLNKDLRDKIDKLSCFPLVVKNFLSKDDINLFMIYVNKQNFGEIYFPRIGIKFKPEPGTMFLFPGTLKYLHGVKKITTGVRHTVATFLTFDNDKHDNYPR